MGMGSRRETAEVDAHGASFITITSDAYAECITHGGQSMNVEAKFHSLRQCRMFAKMDAYKLFRLSLFFEPKEIGEGSILTKEGVASDMLYVVQEGAIDLVVERASPNRLLKQRGEEGRTSGSGGGGGGGGGESGLRRLRSLQRKNSRKKSSGGRNSSGGSGNGSGSLGSNQEGNNEKSIAEKERESGKKHLSKSNSRSTGRNKSGREKSSTSKSTSKKKRKGARRDPSMSEMHGNIDKTFSSAPSKVAITKFMALNLIVSTITTNSTLGETSFLNYAKRNRCVIFLDMLLSFVISFVVPSSLPGNVP